MGSERMTEVSNSVSPVQQPGNPIGLATPARASIRFVVGTVLLLMCLAIVVYAIYGMIAGLNVLATATVAPAVPMHPSDIASEMVFCSKIGYTAVAGSLLGVGLMVSGYRKK
jgi:hypothetical protein